MKERAWPPYELVDVAAIGRAEEKSRRLERLYLLTQERAWDGKAVLAELVERHGRPGATMDPEVRNALAHLLTVLLWGELAAWTISADLALAIEDVDAKMAATAQVFDEARHFTVLREYLLLLEEEPPKLGGLARVLLEEVMATDSLAKKLVGMQLLFETNAVVLFRRIGETGICPVLSELLPYFERDESRHVGLGVLFLPRLLAKMSRAEQAGLALFQARCLSLLIAGGFTLRPHFDALGLDQRLMTQRVTSMQEDVLREMARGGEAQVSGAILNPRRSLGPYVVDFLHPAGGLASAPAWHRHVHGGIERCLGALDRALA